MKIEFNTEYLNYMQAKKSITGTYNCNFVAWSTTYCDVKEFFRAEFSMNNTDAYNSRVYTTLQFGIHSSHILLNSLFIPV